MKKIIALLLAMIMVMSLATVVSANNDPTEPAQPSGPAAGGDGEGTPEPVKTEDYRSDKVAASIKIEKLYEVSGHTNSVYPDETLTFTSTPDASNPDTPNLIVDELDVTGITGQEIKVTLPVYSKVGVYKYEIYENTAAEMQGVTYSEAKIGVTVLVTYNYDEEKLDTEVVLSTTVPEDDSDNKLNIEDGKVDTFINKYDLGSLTISKEVTGNLADQDVYFDFKVVFVSDKPVASDITISETSHESNPTTISHVDGWTNTNGIYTKIVDLKLKHNETITFDDIPAGVMYTVTEDVRHLDTDGVADPNSANDVDYTVSYKANGAEDAISNNLFQGEIEKEDEDSVAYTNNKETEVTTGIAMDSVPFIVMAVVAVIGLAAFTAKKRVQE